MENDKEIITQENDTETTENEEVVVEETTEETESVEDLKKKLATAEAQKEHWRNKANGQKPEAKNSDGLTTKDTIALMNAKVHEDDIDEVVKFAKFENISVADALKSNIVKLILAEKDEKRTSASVANISNSSRGSSQVSVEKLVSDASSGKLPEKDEDIQRLLKSKMGYKK